ncbi:hypothetical protein [Tenacibaculum singaporense]|uniref:hypothetical protein n=1 Tax=Tenacibaculum singaporense TaxID=2358479 RepID=UPI000F6660E7|nr:hypothetical protein [Tenacibaculum singaporense]RSC96043.1 hypothetical protein EI424_02680 [Tenacibaculum singaporense]
MNVTLLEDLCKKRGRIVFENFKSSVENNPFRKINEGIVSDCLQFEINQEFGRGVLKEWIKTNNLNSKAQIDVVTGIINNYKKTIVNTSLSWVKKKYGIVL